MLRNLVLLSTSVYLTMAQQPAATVSSVTASKTDIGSILKTIDQTKLSSIPANARAVMKKMPEDPTGVTMEDRSAIKGCMGDANVDKLGKLAVSFRSSFGKAKSTMTILMSSVLPKMIS